MFNQHLVEHLGTKGRWSARRRRVFSDYILQCDDSDLLSHSLKTTTRSWAAEGNVSMDHRRILGRHMSSIKDSDSIYSRDLLVAPVDDACVRWIKDC